MVLKPSLFRAQYTIFSAECSFLVLNAQFFLLVLNAQFLVLIAQFCSLKARQHVMLKARQHVMLRTQIDGAKSHLEGEKSLKFMNIWCYMNK